MDIRETVEASSASFFGSNPKVTTNNALSYNGSMLLSESSRAGSTPAEATKSCKSYGGYKLCSKLVDCDPA